MKSTPAGAPAPEGRRARKRRETRQRIVDAATKPFLERGDEATTLNDVADAADAARRSVFDYFPTKEDVVVRPRRRARSRASHASRAAMQALPRSDSGAMS